MTDKPNQRKGSTSNTQAGKDFEKKIYEFLNINNIFVEEQLKIKIGISAKKEHAFDFGNDNILVECKSHTWTETLKTPSGKLKNWSEAMFIFYLTPKKYKKLFFVEESYNQKYKMTLLEYFIEHYSYLIPSDVILIDFYTKEENYEVYMYDKLNKCHMRQNKEELWVCLK